MTKYENWEHAIEMLIERNPQMRIALEIEKFLQSYPGKLAMRLLEVSGKQITLAWRSKTTPPAGLPAFVLRGSGLFKMDCTGTEPVRRVSVFEFVLAITNNDSKDYTYNLETLVSYIEKRADLTAKSMQTAHALSVELGPE